MPEPLILHGAPVYLRHDRPPADAIGMADGRVVAAGSLAEVRAAMPAGAETRTLTRGAVLPAFVDPHQHAYLVAADPGTDLLYRRAADVRGLVAEIANLAAAEPTVDPAGPRWLRYHGYEPLLLAEHRSPTAAELDRAAPGRPLHVLTRTFHESAVNSAGLDALGIGRTTPDPTGGRIVRDRRGNPTGVLLEAASFDAEAASRRAGHDTDADIRARLRAHARRLLEHGVVRIGDAAVPADQAGLLVDALAAEGVTATPLLVGSRIHEPALMAGRTAKVLFDGGEYAHLCFTGRQLAALFASSFRAQLGREGTLARAVGNRAGFPKGEADGRWHSGIRFAPEADARDLLRRAADAGSSLAVHADGNGAVEALLNAIAADPGAAAAVTVRLEHAMVLDPTLIGRLADAGLTVAIQPVFLPSMGHELTVAPLPAPMRIMPFATMRAAGIPLAISSDYPAADLAPLVGVSAAATRQDRTGKAIGPDEAIDIATALDAATRVGAELLGAADAGTLEPGKIADLVWADADPHATAAADLPAIRILATWSGGREVFTRPD
jgi:predicted amidohydrolase YtcJ